MMVPSRGIFRLSGEDEVMDWQVEFTVTNEPLHNYKKAFAALT